MTRENLLDLGPSLTVAAGIIGSTLIAVRASGSGGWLLAGPLLLALAVVGADAWASRRRGGPSRPSWAAMILGGSFLVASLILGDPGLVRASLPGLGTVAWVTLLRPGSRRRTCGSF
ncbi:MAG TPA: hypothetical protein VGM86_13960 [Thermoanaerobaculia bacterium]|jgi:hypothetical protein